MEKKSERFAMPFDDYSDLLSYLTRFSQLNRRVIEKTLPENYYRQLLMLLLELTDCRFGLLGFISEKGGQSILHFGDVFDTSWPKQRCYAIEKQLIAGLSIKNFSLLRMNKLTIKEMETVIPLEKLTIDNYLTFPFKSKGKEKCVLILANREQGFEQKVADRLNFFIDGINVLLELIQSRQLIQNLIKKERESLLHNITYLEHSLPNVIDYHQREQKHFCLILLDIVNLNQKIKVLGQDQLITQLIQRFDLNINHRDIVVRAGGERFFLLLNCLPELMMPENVAKSICQFLSAPFYIDGKAITLKFRIGVSYFPLKNKSIDESVAEVERLISDAVNFDRFQFLSEHLDNECMNSHQLEKDLATALDNDELHVEYQPQIHMFTQMITGFEALLRWTHPIRGKIPPSVFIPMAIKNNLSETINTYVLKHAIEDFQYILEKKAYPLKISINVAPRVEDLNAHNQQLIDIIERSGKVADFFKLEAELNESDFSHTTEGNPQDTQDFLNTLKQSDVTLAIDGFEMKQESITRLMEHKFDVLKIDSHITQALDKENSEETKKRITLILEMAKHLNIDVIAKGVETKSQADQLKSMGCAKAQGFYYFHPLDIEQVHNLLNEKNSLKKSWS